MVYTYPSPTRNLSYDEFVSRLIKHNQVEGLILIGSKIKKTQGSASDFDLVVILRHSPISIHVGITVVDKRLTDLIFYTIEQVEDVLELVQAVHVESDLGRLIRWLQNGRIIFDRSGCLKLVQEKVLLGNWLMEISNQEIERVSSRINFNLQHNLRMLGGDDDVYLQALDVRLLYSIFEVFFGYFAVRKLFWEGEKWAVGYLKVYDPVFLKLFMDCLSETNRHRKTKLYQELAELALDEVGGVWPDGYTAIELKQDSVSQGQTDGAALEIWESLIGE
jgi:hypothetical protein